MLCAYEYFQQNNLDQVFREFNRECAGFFYEMRVRDPKSVENLLSPEAVLAKYRTEERLDYEFHMKAYESDWNRLPKK